MTMRVIIVIDAARRIRQRPENGAGAARAGARRGRRASERTRHGGGRAGPTRSVAHPLVEGAHRVPPLGAAIRHRRPTRGPRQYESLSLAMVLEVPSDQLLNLSQAIFTGCLGTKRQRVRLGAHLTAPPPEVDRPV